MTVVIESVRYYIKKGRKEMSKGSSASGGIGFAGLLTVAFVVLKLMNIITWSWLWVLSPLWIGFLLIVAIITVADRYMETKRGTEGSYVPVYEVYPRRTSLP